MAKFHSSTFGAISGKHGSAVAVTRKDGISYIRMHVIPHNPRTDKQQAHRSKIGLVSKSLAPFNPIFKHTMGVTNGISIARSHAFKNAIVDEYPNFSIDYKKLMFSFGTLQKLQNATTSFHNGVVSINWDFKKMHNCHANDSVNLVVFNKDSNQAIHIEDIATRKKKQAKIDIHNEWTNDELYFWAYARNGDKISDSVFVDVVEASRSLSGLCVCPNQEPHNLYAKRMHDNMEGINNYGVINWAHTQVRPYIADIFNHVGASRSLSRLCVCPINTKPIYPNEIADICVHPIQ